MAEDIFDVVAGSAADVASTAVGYGLYGGYRVGQATYNYLRSTKAPTNPNENNGNVKQAMNEETDLDMAIVTYPSAEERYATPNLGLKVRDRLDKFSVTRRNHNENTNLNKKASYLKPHPYDLVFYGGLYNASKTNVSKKRYGKKKKTFYRYKKSR